VSRREAAPHSAQVLTVSAFNRINWANGGSIVEEVLPFINIGSVSDM
jgi:hypothetical protein